MSDDLKISEIEEKYDGQWVVVEITKVDKYKTPLRGRVLFHGTNQDDVYGQGRKYRDIHSNVDLYYFYVGDPIPHGMALMPVFGVTSSGELIKIAYEPIRALT